MALGSSLNRQEVNTPQATKICGSLHRGFNYKSNIITTAQKEGEGTGKPLRAHSLHIPTVNLLPPG